MYHHPETMHQLVTVIHRERCAEAARLRTAAHARRPTPRWIGELTEDQPLRHRSIWGGWGW